MKARGTTPNRSTAQGGGDYAAIGQALEDPILDLHLFTDLTMQWWDGVVDALTEHRPVAFQISHRQCRVLNFALKEMRKRAYAMECRYAADEDGGQ